MTALTRHTLPPAALLALAVSLANGDPVYKSIDADGNVSYGDAAASGARVVEEMPITPPPSIDEVLEAKLISAQIEDRAERMEAERLAREKLKADREAREAAIAAEERAAAEAVKAAEMERLAQQRKARQGSSKGKKRPGAKPGQSSDTANSLINMGPGVPLLNLPGPPE